MKGKINQENGPFTWLLCAIVALSFYHAPIFNINLGIYLSPLRLAVVVYVIGLLVLLLSGVRLAKESYVVIILTTFFLFCILVSVIFGVDIKNGIRAIAFYFFGAFISLSVSIYLIEGGSYKALCWVIGFVVILLLLFSTFESISGFHLLSSKLYGMNFNGLGPVTATYYNPNDLSYALAVSLSFLIPFLIDSGRKSYFLKILAFIFLSWCIFVFMVNSANAAIIVSAVFTCLFVLVMMSPRLKAFSVGVSFFLLFLPAGFLFILILYWFGIFDFLASINLMASSGGSVTIRANIALCALQAVSDRYGLGVGPGNSELIISMCEYDTKDVYNPHSFIVEGFLELGFVFLFLCLVIVVIYLFYRNKSLERETDRSRGTFVSPIFYLVVVVLIGSLGPSSAIDMPVHWVALGGVLAFALKKPESVLR